MENWNVVRLLPGELLSNSSKQFGERAWIQLDEHGDGGGPGKDVIKPSDVRVAVRPNMCQVKDLKRKLTGVKWKGRGNSGNERSFASWPS